MTIHKIGGLHRPNSHDDNSDFDFSSGALGGQFQGLHHGPHAPPPHAIEFRSIDGSGNNLSNLTLNSAGTDFARIGPAHFAGNDGHSMVDGPNPREISNTVVGQGDADVPNPQGFSALLYAWGQFIDHDLDLSKSGGDPINIAVPDGDPGLPGVTDIPLTRALIDPATGTAADPATAINSITGWLDGSMVYGSSQATADGLRLPDGHMKTSAGDNLPIDPVSGMFMAGDVRAAENPDLTALQTLFVREHNHQVDLLHQQHPTWTGDQLYQQARAIVSAEIEHITLDEFLPHLLGPNTLTSYHGYDPNVDPRITEEFAGAAYRFGHSIVSQDIEKIGEQGQALAQPQDLKDVFFQPASDFVLGDGADALLRALSSDQSRALDARIVDDLRNFLSDPPDGMDLAAINIQRGRDLGLGTLNETRIALGLTPYSSIDDLTDDSGTAAALKLAYGNDVNKIDLWTGGLSETHAAGAMLGETFQVIIAHQFEALRDGDRLWYENQGFDAKTLAAINHTTLSDIIERNTDTGHIQDDVFVSFDRHSGSKGGIDAENPDAPQLVIGSKGFDTLIGGAQGDVLVAATGGVQTMTGLQGADQFVFGHGTNAVITDFKPGQDKIVSDDAGSLGFHDVHIKADHSNTVVEANGNHIVLTGVSPYQLHAYDFVYNH